MDVLSDYGFLIDLCFFDDDAVIVQHSLIARHALYELIMSLNWLLSGT